MMVYLLDWIALVLVILIYQFLEGRCFPTSRFAGKSFTDSFVYRRKVTCDASNDTREIYPAPTWTCSNMRIDGMRLRKQYMKQTSTSSSPHTKFQTIYDAKNDIKALCGALLQQHSIDQPVWITYVKETATDEIHSDRVIFKQTNAAFDWEVLSIQPNITGRGYIKTLACTVDT